MFDALGDLGELSFELDGELLLLISTVFACFAHSTFLHQLGRAIFQVYLGLFFFAYAVTHGLELFRSKLPD